MQEADNNNLTVKIGIGLIAGFVVGCACYFFMQYYPEAGFSVFLKDYIIDGVFHVGGKIFVNLLKMMIVPLVFVSLICGVASTEEVKSLGRLGIKTFLLYLMTTGIAISLALAMATIIDPGAGIHIDQTVNFEAKQPPPFTQVLINIFPSNPIQSMSDGAMLQVIVFAIMVGIALTHTGEAGERITRVFVDLNVVIMKLVQMIMGLAPYGVFFLVAKVFANQGPDILLGLGQYVFAVIFALLLHVIFTYGAIVQFIARLNPLIFIRRMWSAIMFAFSTASSAATMPITLGVVEKRLGVKNSVASFTIPLGTTVNMDGTAIMQGVATVFIAGAYGIDLTLGDFLAVIATATLASIGTAAVPSAGMITLAMVLGQVGLPAEAIGLILGVDRILDMIRTAVNVTGDAAVTTAVARTENALNIETFYNGEASSVQR
ncbi:MAG: dicarboxylate/amino acid:cation symporter [Gammaproteobacteria bacterium]|nr:MAG: dicarboxylate/amino acid:cation symporter [Gammaproteobacteria bacterium]